MEIERGLRRLKFLIYTTLSKEFIDDLAAEPSVSLTACERWATNLVSMAVRYEIWGKVVDKAEASYPADWKEAIKERFAPAWFKRRWPVQMKWVRLTARELYPKMALPERDDGMIHLDKQFGSFRDS